MQGVSYANDDTFEARDLVGALEKSNPNAPFATINYTHHTALIKPARLLNGITKVTEQQSTNRRNGRRSEVEKKPEQARAQVIHKYPTRQQ